MESIPFKMISANTKIWWRFKDRKCFKPGFVKDVVFIQPYTLIQIELENKKKINVIQEELDIL